MKTRIITTLAIAMFVTTLAATAIHAQSASNLSVTIPFAFTVADQTLPAGEYHVARSMDSGQAVIQIRNRENGKSLYLPLTHAVQGKGIQEESKVVFNKYGDQYFLSQVWTAGRAQGEELNTTSRERALRTEIAQLKAKPETVRLAVRSN